MSDDERMTIDERYKYLRKMQKRYREAKRAERSVLLGEMEQVTGLHRKSLVRLMGGELARQPRERQRGKRYGVPVRAAVVVIAESLDWVCAERLQPNLVWMAEHLERHGELELSDEVHSQLGSASVSTVQRLLADVRRDRPRLPQRGPEQANRLARDIPAGRIPWDEKQPGHFEVDLVHHSGPSASGQYVHTLQMVDVATGWSERVAILGRSYRVVKDAFERIEQRLPFVVREVHPDNGSEFLNNHLVRYWTDRASTPRLTRSRAWQKNDNRFVEQKNASLVRAYLGHDRLDTVQQTLLLNQLYEVMGLYYNLFQPVMRLTSKTPVYNQQGRLSRTKRRFDDAQTPFDRLCATGDLELALQLRLTALRDSLNPRQLRLDLYSLIDQIFALPCAVPEGVSQDVYLTLFNPPDSLKGGDIPPVTLSNERTIPVR
jgi:hypothetical protein